MRILSVTQLKPIQVNEGGFVFPHNNQTSIVLDTKSASNNKLHELVYQQGRAYGQVGDCCDYLTNQELLDLEAKGMISIKKTK